MLQKKINVLLLTTSFTLFLYLSVLVAKNVEFKLDTLIFSMVEKMSIIHPQVFYYMTKAGSPLLIFLLALTIGLMILLVKKDIYSSIFIWSVPMAGSFLNRGLKLIFKRQRPLINEIVDGTGYSFPSGHSTVSMIFFGCCIYLIARSGWNQTIKWISCIILVSLIFFIGTSRIYFRVHYPTDVLGGYAFGLSFLMLCILLFDKRIKANHPIR